MNERLEFHPISNLFRLMAGENLDELVADIRQNGLLQPVMLFEGKILDGRNRYRACRLAGVEPKFVEFKGTKEEALDRMWSLNISRPHLTADDRACAAALRNKLDDESGAVREAARQRQGVKASRNEKGQMQPVIPPAKTLRRRAEAAATNRQYVALADKLLEEEPEVFKQVQTGHKRLSQIWRERIKRNTGKQRRPAKAKPRSSLDRFVEGRIKLIDALVKEPQPVSLQRLLVISGLAQNFIVRNAFIPSLALVPWLTITPARTPHSHTYKIDRYLRAVCEGRVPLTRDHKALLAALADLRDEIDRERREAKIRRADSKWNPQIINVTELKNLIDHIEMRLDTLTQSGKD